jgi:hypothetical protein
MKISRKTRIWSHVGNAGAAGLASTGSIQLTGRDGWLVGEREVTVRIPYKDSGYPESWGMEAVSNWDRHRQTAIDNYHRMVEKLKTLNPETVVDTDYSSLVSGRPVTAGEALEILGAQA